MKEQIIQIAYSLEKGIIDENLAKSELCKLFDVMPRQISNEIIDKMLTKQMETYGDNLTENLDAKYHYAKGFGDLMIVLSEHYKL